MRSSVSSVAAVIVSLSLAACDPSATNAHGRSASSGGSSSSSGSTSSGGPTSSGGASSSGGATSSGGSASSGGASSSGASSSSGAPSSSGGATSSGGASSSSGGCPTGAEDGPSVLINAGGPAAGTFAADRSFSGGSTRSVSGDIETSLIPCDPPPAAVFQSERSGEFTYTIAGRLPGSRQTVTLYFAETSLTGAGQRAFDVRVNGTAALTAFDIFAAAGGANRAVARAFGATADASGQVVIQFVRGTADAPKVNAVAVAGATSEISISTARPPDAARLHGPTVVAGRPQASFLHAIPATGRAPITFSATGLPAGLTLAPSTGVVSGTMPAAGSYPVTVTATNTAGSATATLTLVAGATLALTPPLGWNSYDSFGGGVTEQEVLDAAQAMKTHLAPFGWNHVVVDYLWYDGEQRIDANGRWLPSPSRFPSATGSLGFKPLADRIHGMGLLFGIHLMRGVPRKSVSARSPIAGSSYTAADAGNTSDACSWDSHMWGVRGDTAAGQAWYDSIFAQYAEWGVDFIKIDDMVSGGNYHRAEVEAVRKAIDKTGRAIVLSLSPGPMQPRDASSLNASANMWRMVNDFWDQKGLSSLDDEFDAANAWQAVDGLTPGHWPDADMLPLGYIGPRCPVHGAGPSALSHNLQVTVMTLWSILPSPLMFGGNVPALGTDATGPWTVALLTNEEMLAVVHDSLGARAKRVRKDGSTEVWARSLSGGRKAVALFNRGSREATVTASFTELGVSGAQGVRDVWRRKDVGPATGSLSVVVPPQGALLYTLAPSASPGVTGADSGR